MKRLFLIFASVVLFATAQAQVETSTWFASSAAESGPTNILSNGTFDDGSDWTAGANWSIGGGVASYDNGGTGNISQADGDMVSSVQINTDYTVQFDVTNLSGSNGFVSFNSSDAGVSYLGSQTITNGSMSFDFSTSSSVGIGGLQVRSLDDGAWDMDNLVLFER